MSDSPVRVDVDGQILIVTLDRPKANAVDAATSRALYDAFVQLRDDPNLRVGIITGGGEKFFCAGWDLKAATEGESAAADWGGGGFAGITEFWDLGKPVIAAVNGYAFGGGFELALAADLIVSADHAVYALTEARLGLAADAGGLFRVPARLPRAIAFELLATGRRMSAHEAHNWGLVNRVVPQAELMAEAKDLANSLIESAPISLAAILEVMDATYGMNPQDGFARIRQGLPYYSKVYSSEDAQEGPRAFVEGRPPVWKGR